MANVPAHTRPVTCAKGEVRKINDVVNPSRGELFRVKFIWVHPEAWVTVQCARADQHLRRRGNLDTARLIIVYGIVGAIATQGAQTENLLENPDCVGQRRRRAIRESMITQHRSLRTDACRDISGRDPVAVRA